MKHNICDEIIRKGGLDRESAICAAADMPLQELLDMAAYVTEKCVPDVFDTCSIINAKSGRCPEDCKWCAQSARHHTGADEYPLLDTDSIVSAAKTCMDRGIGRFSIVTSGRRLVGKEVDAVCRAAEAVRNQCGIYLCLSAGLLDRDSLRRLHDAGVKRYHCNLETAPSHFSALCTTHTQAEKMEVLENALSVGMEICSGGIIGMGETMEQRIELAFVLKGLGVRSVPVNILSPIPGTPLEGQPLISEEDILRTIAVFRLIMPGACLRLAGGRARLSESTLMTAFRIGINAAIIGDMLTTTGSDIETDKARIIAAGYKL